MSLERVYRAYESLIVLALRNCIKAAIVNEPLPAYLKVLASVAGSDSLWKMACELEDLYTKELAKEFGGSATAYEGSRRVRAALRRLNFEHGLRVLKDMVKELQRKGYIARGEPTVYIASLSQLESMKNA